MVPRTSPSVTHSRPEMPSVQRHVVQEPHGLFTACHDTAVLHLVAALPVGAWYAAIKGRPHAVLVLDQLAAPAAQAVYVDPVTIQGSSRTLHMVRVISYTRAAGPTGGEACGVRHHIEDREAQTAVLQRHPAHGDARCCSGMPAKQQQQLSGLQARGRRGRG